MTDACERVEAGVSWLLGNPGAGRGWRWSFGGWPKDLPVQRFRNMERAACPSCLPFFSRCAALIVGLPEDMRAVCNSKPPLVTGPRAQVHRGSPGAGGLH